MSHSELTVTESPDASPTTNNEEIADEIGGEDIKPIIGGQSKSRRKSELWSFFSPIDRHYALCSVCDVKFSYRTSTSNLRKHLVKRHKVIPLLNSKDGNEIETPTEEGSENMVPASERLQVKRDITMDPCNESINSKRNCLEDLSHFPKHVIRDEFDAFGFTIAAKLRKMEVKQRLYCEKIINEALFKGAFEQLSPTSDLVVYVS